ncbi:MAG TPA: sugar-binding protein [Tepidisphaeraceae bacterium]
MSGQRIIKSALATCVSGGLALALSMAAATIGCNRESGSNNGGAGGTSTATTQNAGERKFAFVTNNASDFWKIASAGVHKYEKEKGVAVDIKMPPNGKVEEQNGIIEDLVAQGYNGIAVSVIAPNDQVAEINRAAAKTNVICFDSDCPKSNRLAYIGTNNFEAGKVLGEQIVKLLPNGGKMAVFCGTFAADNAKQRLDGVKEAIKGHNIEIVAQKEDQTDRNKARTNVEDVLNSYSDLNLLCGLWSYNGPAIVKAVDASGKKGKVLVAVFDEEQGTLDGIENGTVSCTVVQKPFQFGYLSAQLMDELATKGKSALPNPPVIDTGVRIIDAKNVADFKAELAKLKAEG